MHPAPKLIAFDLDGTLTQHRTPLGAENRAVLSALAERYALIMVGAGTCQRIFAQMGSFPIDILGSYGMQYAEHDPAAGGIVLRWDERAPVDRDEVFRRAHVLREKYGLYPFAGESLEIHPTGSLTFPVLGTSADIAHKLAYDPDRSRRKVMYPFVCELFHDYRVVIGGSSSFDIIPGRYGKYNALLRVAAMRGIAPEEIVYCGDDYGEGGNDHDVYAGGIPFIKVDSYENLKTIIDASGLLAPRD